jgi:hypothetical protein
MGLRASSAKTQNRRAQGWFYELLINHLFY